MNLTYWIPIIVSIILGVPTLIFAILTYLVNTKSKNIADNMDKREKDHYNKEIDAKAREFISKYNTSEDPQILLLFAAIIAYKFNSTYTYHRQFYIDFNNLSDDVKNRVLEIRHIICNIDSEQNFYNKMKNRLLYIIKHQYPNETFTMFNGSHDYLLDTYKINKKVNMPIEVEFKIREYCSNSETPISDINKNLNWQTVDHDLKIFIINITASFLSLYSINDDDYHLIHEIISDIDEYSSYENDTYTYEDLFLITLSKIYAYNDDYVNYLKERIDDNEI